MLLGDVLAARFDLKTDREKGVLEVRATHIESGQDASLVAKAAAGELQALARFVGAGGIKVGRRGDLARALSREVAALPS
jgi:uncharacterized protein